jgi:RNA polymerase sigma factor for flagellar operon FliA
MERVADDIMGVWKQYRRTGGEALRNALMEAYLPIVKYNAERIYAKLPDEVELDDLISAGIFGLIDAIEAFDLARGVKFETYCAPRIRGAILDELRTMDWVPRLVRHRAAKLEKATQSLVIELGRAPNEDELAARLKLSREEFDKLRRDANAVSVISLSRKYYETDSNREVCEVDVLQDHRGPDPVTEIQKRDVKDLVTRGLSRTERLIVSLYYYEELTMKEIGLALDLSESRVSQMHSSIVDRLKAHLHRRMREIHA